MKLAIASDLHCHETAPDKQAESFLTVGLATVPRSAHPIEALKQRIRESNLTADFLMCPGDLANRCSVLGLRAGWEAVQEIGEALNVQGILATLGNHDVDSRAVHGGDPFEPARGLGPSFPLGSADLNDEFWAKHFCILPRPGSRLLVVDSVASHTNAEEAKHGLITDATLEALSDALVRLDRRLLGVALVHHHPHPHEDIDLGAADLMHGGQKLLDLLTRFDFSLVIHGHKHHPKVSYAQGGATSPSVFAVGSLTHMNHSRLASNTRNLFHVIELTSTDLPGCSVAGRIQSWEYNWLNGWNPSTARSSGFPAEAGFGCRIPPRELSNQVLSLVESTAEWGALQASVPQLAYLLPQDEDRLLKILEESDIQVLRDDVGEPYLLRRR